MTHEELTIRQAQRRLDVSRNTLLTWLADGYIEGRKDGDLPTSAWLIPASEIDRVKRERAEALAQEIRDLGFEVQLVPAAVNGSGAKEKA